MTKLTEIQAATIVVFVVWFFMLGVGVWVGTDKNLATTSTVRLTGILQPGFDDRILPIERY